MQVLLRVNFTSFHLLKKLFCFFFRPKTYPHTRESRQFFYFGPMHPKATLKTFLQHKLATTQRFHIYVPIAHLPNAYKVKLVRGEKIAGIARPFSPPFPPSSHLVCTDVHILWQYLHSRLGLHIRSASSVGRSGLVWSARSLSRVFWLIALFYLEVHQAYTLHSLDECTKTTIWLAQEIRSANQA